MKRTNGLLVIFASLFALGMVPNLQAEEDRICTNATLRGPYVAITHGTIFDDRGLSAGVGVLTFDGEGKWSGAVTFVDEGRGVHRDTPSGTYTVNPDCTGSSALFDFVILDGGKEVHMIITRPDRVVTWVLKRQFPRHHRDEED